MTLFMDTLALLTDAIEQKKNDMVCYWLNQGKDLDRLYFKVYAGSPNTIQLWEQDGNSKSGGGDLLLNQIKWNVTVDE